MSELTRRQALAGAALGAASLAACGSTKTAAQQPEAKFEPGDWASVKAQFELDPGLHHFSQFLLAAHPRPVREAIARHRAGLDRNTTEYMHSEQEALEEKDAAAAAKHFGVAAEDIAFTDSTTMGLGLVYGGLRLPRGAEALTTRHDHYATHESLRLRAVRTGVRVRQVALYSGVAASASEADIVRRLERAVSRRTRLLAVTWVHSGTGLKLPVAAIAAMLRRVNARRRPGDRVLLAVDGVHGLGAEPADLRELGCDIFVAGTHKWLGGPRGTGIVWARPSVWRRIDPIVPSFEGVSYGAWIDGDVPRGAPPGPLHTPGGFHSFEHRWALAEAFAFQEHIGQARIADRTHELATRLKKDLAALRGVDVVTPSSRALSAGLVCFDVAGQDPGVVVERLRADHEVVATVTPYAARHVRVGCGLGVDGDQVSRLAGAVRAIAA
jgi:selenocysteine lyase/cysteine desulfurase